MENANIIDSTAVPVEQMSLAGFLRIPAVRQVMLLFGVAAAVAAGVAIVLWSQTPNYTQLYRQLDNADAGQVAEALRSANIRHKLDTDSGVVMVAKADLHDARLLLASQGLPQGSGSSMESLDEQSSFGVSEFMENARYKHALEQELARTIAHLGAVSEARVHLAIPRRTSFVRDRSSASASVLLTLFRGRELESDQASAIVHLVSGSIENLPASNVTVVDQSGRLLSSAGAQLADAQAATRFKQTQRVEESYRGKVEALLSPIVGADRVRAQVFVDMDFSEIEETRESFDPASAVVRSEQVNEEQRRNETAGAEGVPGALSNQPPEAAAGNVAAAASAEGGASEPLSTARSATRNFEMDRTISRTRPQSGNIVRVSVAVLVDDSPVLNEEGEELPGLAAADLAKFDALVKEAIGFDAARGDTVVVETADFVDVEEQPPAEEPAIWQNPTVQDVAKQGLGIALALGLAFGLVRPFLNNLVAATPAVGELAGATVTLSPEGVPQLAAGGQLAIPPPSYDEKVAAAKNITGHDPARVAQVVRKWVTTDE